MVMFVVDVLYLGFLCAALLDKAQLDVQPHL